MSGLSKMKSVCAFCSCSVVIRYLFCFFFFSILLHDNIICDNIICHSVTRKWFSSRWPASLLALLLIDCLLSATKLLLWIKILSADSFTESRNVRKFIKTCGHMSNLMLLRYAQFFGHKSKTKQTLFCILVYKERAWDIMFKRHLRCTAHCSNFFQNQHSQSVTPSRHGIAKSIAIVLQYWLGK